MRKILLFFIAFSVVACAKDDLNPSNLKDGQRVELFLDHYDDIAEPKVFLLPGKTPSSISLSGFKERELGYTYKIRARVWVSPQPVMDDGVNSLFEFVTVISKQKYTGAEPFEIGLVFPIGFGSGGNLAVKKEDGRFSYGEYNLRPIDEVVSQELDALLHQEKAIGGYEEYQKYQESMRRLALKAVVTHDADHEGKGYVVHGLKTADKK